MTMAAIIGGWEIVFILGCLIIFTLGAVVLACVVYLIVRATQKKVERSSSDASTDSDRSERLSRLIKLFAIICA